MATGSEGDWPLGSPRLSSEGEDEGAPEVPGVRPRRRFSFGTVGKSLANLANNVGESLARTAAAAGELLTDAELRSRSAALLTESAKKAGAGVAKGLQQGAGRIAAGPRTVQSILQKLQQRIEEQRLQALLREQQDTPVDVQVAFQLYEDAPQELRSRLWMALLEHPELVQEYQTLAVELQRQRQEQPAAASPSQGGGSSSSDASAGAAAAAQHEKWGQQHGLPMADGQGSPAGAAAAGAAEMQLEAERVFRAGGDEGMQATGSRPCSVEDAGPSAGGERSEPSSPSENDPAHLSSSYSAPWAAARHVGSSTSSPRPGHPYAHLQPPRGPEEDSGWQLVSDQAAAWKLQGSKLLAVAGQHPPYSREREGFRNVLMAAMMSIPWPLPSEYPPDCRYATLLQISLGQEDIDEVISRDLHRTFPEHPLFAFEQGQQALFNVLKASALHDMEASYCQGMAFVAGLLLFYVPEEPSFQLFSRLLSTSGPNLRRLYLPGLEGLKAELRKLEFLLDRFLPNLAGHLNAAGVVPVLYASQWLLTCYSCPFPVSFACRIIDVMLQENRDTIMLKVAVAILAECEGDLLMQEGFEQLLTHLKADVVQWSHQRLRRVLSAALASPITAQDLADAEAALQQGYTGSLSRAPTFSADAAAAVSRGEEAEGGLEAEGAAASPATAGGTATPAPASRATSLASQHSMSAAAATAAAPGTAAGEDTVAADLAAAQQQIDDELLDMVMQLNLAWDADDDAEENYSNTLHSVSGGRQG